jgi:hypothetical protein
MPLMKIATLAAALFWTAAAMPVSLHAQAQADGNSTQEQSQVKDFKKPTADTLKTELSAEQFAVTQQCGTEPPFKNLYWDNHKPGAVCGRGVRRAAVQFARQV